MRKFSLLESFKYTDAEIEDFFFEFFENKNFGLKSGFVKQDKEGRNNFFTDSAYVNEKTKECKRVSISFENKSKGVYDQQNSCLSMDNLDIINSVISTIKKFYTRSSEPISFSINQKWDDIEVTFFIIGPIVGQSHLENKGQISQLLGELVPILKNRGYKRVNHKSTNWLEIRTPRKKIHGWDTDMVLRNIFERAIAGNLTQNEKNQPLIDWVNKVINLNYTISYGGGDLQVVVSLKKSN